MGNFYTNIVLRDADSDAVAATVGRMKRRAYVAGGSTATIVFDEACDRQDLKELERLAGKLSGPHGPALAICNHDDDVLWYALAVDGRIVDRYNSFPSYLDEGGDDPAGGDAERLCAAFGATKRAADVGALLRRQHADVGLEVDRHLELCRLLDLPTESVGMGYGYVESGEFSGEPGTPKAIGQAGEADRTGQAAAQTRAPAPPPPGDASFHQIIEDIGALLRSDIDVPAEISHVLGSGRVNAMLALERLKGYMATHRLLVVGPPMMVRGDAVTETVLGVRDLPFGALNRVFGERFGVPPLTDAEKAAARSGDAKYLRSQTEAMERVLDQRQRDVGRR